MMLTALAYGCLVGIHTQYTNLDKWCPRLCRPICISFGGGHGRTDEEFGLVRAKHWSSSQWPRVMALPAKRSSQASGGLMADLCLFTGLSFLYCCCIRYIISRTVWRGNRGWMCYLSPSLPSYPSLVCGEEQSGIRSVLHKKKATELIRNGIFSYVTWQWPNF